jgi:hypothetical protein
MFSVAVLVDPTAWSTVCSEDEIVVKRVPDMNRMMKPDLGDTGERNVANGAAIATPAATTTDGSAGVTGVPGTVTVTANAAGAVKEEIEAARPIESTKVELDGVGQVRCFGFQSPNQVGQVA